MQVSVVIITYNEEANIGRTLASVQALVSNGKGEIIVVDSSSTDRTVEIAKSHGAKVFVEEWMGFAAQKNSAIEKAGGDWILSLDADEEVDADLLDGLTGKGHNSPPYEWCLTMGGATSSRLATAGFTIRRKNFFLGRWIKHGGFWPDPKLRLFRRGSGRFQDRAVHEDVQIDGLKKLIELGTLLHYSYPHPFRLHRAHEPLFVARGGDGRRQRQSRIQLHQHRPAAAVHVHLQLHLPPGIPRWSGRPAAAPLSRGVRVVEIREGVGIVTSAEGLSRSAR